MSVLSESIKKTKTDKNGKKVLGISGQLRKNLGFTVGGRREVDGAARTIARRCRKSRSSIRLGAIRDAIKSDRRTAEAC